MGKKKLIHFRENLTFPHLFQPSYHQLESGFVHKGSWNSQFFRKDHPIIAELGCGKGEYTIGLAARHPEKNYIGIDIKGARLWRGCKSVEEQNLDNVAFVRTRVDHLTRVFGREELSELWITFPDPQPKKERLRLTSPVFLSKYRDVLHPDGIIHLKTDDHPFFEYSLSVIQQNRHKILWMSDDLYATGTDDEVALIQTYYESKWLEMNKKIFYLRFQLSQHDN